MRPLQRLLGCWLPGVQTMGSECLALQWGFVGRLLPAYMACAPRVRVRVPILDGGGWAAPTRYSTRRRRSYRSRETLLDWLVSYRPLAAEGAIFLDALYALKFAPATSFGCRERRPTITLPTAVIASSRRNDVQAPKDR